MKTCADETERSGALGPQFVDLARIAEVDAAGRIDGNAHRTDQTCFDGGPPVPRALYEITCRIIIITVPTIYVDMTAFI